MITFVPLRTVQGTVKISEGVPAEMKLVGILKLPHP